MSSVGPYLRELRERRGVSIEEISRTTRVGRSYLEALEAGDASKLPAPVFTRGFILAYCQALGEPPEEALTRYSARDDEAPEPAAATRTTARDRSAGRGRGTVLVSFVLLIVLGIALFAVALVLQSTREAPGERRADGRRGDVKPIPRATDTRRDAPLPPVAGAPTGPGAPATTPDSGIAAVTVDGARPNAPTPPSPAPGSATSSSARPTTPGGVPPGGPAPTTPPAATRSVPATTMPPLPSSPPAGDSTAATTKPPPAPPTATVTQQEVITSVGQVNAPYRLVARTNALTWIRVRTGDGHQTDETVPAGQVREWVSNRPFTVSVGNAGGVRLELNGKPLPPLGASGAVISGIVLPGTP